MACGPNQLGHVTSQSTHSCPESALSGLSVTATLHQTHLLRPLNSHTSSTARVMPAQQQQLAQAIRLDLLGGGRLLMVTRGRLGSQGGGGCEGGGAGEGCGCGCGCVHSSCRLCTPQSAGATFQPLRVVPGSHSNQVSVPALPPSHPSVIELQMGIMALIPSGPWRTFAPVKPVEQSTVNCWVPNWRLPASTFWPPEHVKPSRRTLSSVRPWMLVSFSAAEHCTVANCGGLGLPMTSRAIA